MPYHRFSQAELEKAGSVNIIDYARRQGYEVFEYHRGYFKIPGYGGLLLEPDKWYWQTEHCGGGPIQFVMKMKHLSWVDAVKELLQEQDQPYQQNTDSYKKRVSREKGSPFVLPKPNSTYKHMFAYLIHSRKLDQKLIQNLVDQKRLYEDTKENCVFVGYDAHGDPRYAFLRGTKSHISYRGDAAGSDKRYSFSVSGTTDTLYVFEAAIDLLSYQTIQIQKGESIQDHYLSMAGCSMIALDYYLTNHSIQDIYVCSDHDEAGDAVYHQILDQYGMLYFIGRQSPAPYKDYNELLIRKSLSDTLQELQLEAAASVSVSATT